MCNNEITQFYLPPTHEPYMYLPLLPSRKALITAIWLVLIPPTHEGMARLSYLGAFVAFNV